MYMCVPSPIDPMGLLPLPQFAGLSGCSLVYMPRQPLHMSNAPMYGDAFPPGNPTLPVTQETLDTTP